MRKLLLTTALMFPLAAAPVLAQDTTTPPAADPAAPAADAAADSADAAADAAGDAAEAAGDAASDAADAAGAAADDAADAAADATAEGEAAAEDAAEAAAAAEVAASGKVAQEQAANELRVDWITGTTVTAPDGTEIGAINDLIVDGESGQMIAAVVGVGGFLGIGAKQIAVPFDQLTVNYDAQEITTDLTKEEADAAPEYVFREREAAPAAAGDAGMGTTAPATDPAAAPATDPAAAPATDPATAPATGAPAN